MASSPTSNNSSPISPLATTAPVRRLSEKEWHAVHQFDASLSAGPKLLRPMVKRMLKEGLDARELYQLSVDAQQAVLARSGLPPMKLPTWKELIESPPTT